MHIKNCLLSIVALSMAAFLVACSSTPKTLEYRIHGDADQVLNRDINGKSLSVVVRIYQLKDAKEFSKLTFDAIASGRPESDFLGTELLAKTDAVVIPGGSYESVEKLLDETRFIGIVAFFRKPDAFYWRQLAAAETVREQGLTFRVQDCYVMLQGDKFVALPGQPVNGRPDCGAATLMSNSSFNTTR